MPKITLQTDYLVAKDSLDYLVPLGAIEDNSKSFKFNEKLKLLNGSVLDLGCAGGGFVKDCLDEGRIAVGIEGSDYNIRRGRHEWRVIPNNLFTGDITKPFQVLIDGEKALFDIITAWEVLEHIHENDLAQLFTNIDNHLAKNGVIIVSISNKPSLSSGDIDLHVTKKDQNWWEAEISEYGFKRNKDLEHHFAPDWLRNERKSFHFVLERL